MRISLRTFRGYFEDLEKIDISELPKKPRKILDIFLRDRVPLDQIHITAGSQEVKSVVLPKGRINARSIANVKRALLESEHLSAKTVKNPYWGGKMWKLSFVPQIDLSPYIRELRDAGAKDEHITSCKRGFICFLKCGWDDCIPALVSGYKIMLGPKTTGSHLETLLYYALYIYRDEPKGVKAYHDMARVFADLIKEGATPEFLILRAGNAVAGALHSMDDETFERVFASNEK